MVDVAVPLDWKVRDKEDEEILEYQDLYIYRHYGIQRGGVIPTRTPDIVIISRTKHTTTMVDVAVPLDWKVRDKEDEEILEYQDLYIYRHYGDIKRQGNTNTITRYSDDQQNKTYYYNGRCSCASRLESQR